jgi:hypothetical protein
MKKFLAFGLLMVAFVLPAAFAGPGVVPGVELGATESQSISGGQCVFIQIQCFQASNNCSVGMCFRNSNFGSPGTVAGINPSICLNGLNGLACCGSTLSPCANQ